MLNVANLSSGYGGMTVLRNITIDVNAGEIVAIVGANGAGKTTLLKTIAGVLRPTDGEITYEGKLLNKLPPPKIVELGISLVKEGGEGIFTNMTVLDNLYVASHLGRSKSRRQELFGIVFALFPRIKERSSQKAGTLSGGERRMLKIAMGLLSSPSILMLDEPSQGLAPVIVAEVYQKIVEIHKMQKNAILLVEQNLYQALDIADRAYVLENGKVVLTGDAKKILDMPDVQEKYLGIKAT